MEFRSDFVNLFNQANRNNPIRDISGVTATGGSVFLSRQLRAASWLEFPRSLGDWRLATVIVAPPLLFAVVMCLRWLSGIVSSSP